MQEHKKLINANEVMSTLRKHMLIDGIDVVIDFDKSKGSYIADARNGKKYLDLFTFVASNPVGMNHPKLNNPEFINYIGKIALSKPSNSDIYNIEMAQFVKTFFEIAVPSYFKYSFFIEGGSLAIENALKVAFDWKVKKNFAKGYKHEVGHQVLHLKQAFHGRTGYTLSLTNTDAVKTDHYPKFNWPRVTNPKITFPLLNNAKNLDEVLRLEKQSIEEIKEAVVKFKDDIACIILEPIQGEGGDNHFRKEYFEQLRIICNENEMLLIIDEVQTGVGLTGKWWAHQHFTEPDIIAFGKKTQVCGILVSDKIDDVENHVFKVSSRINSTWGGNVVDMVRFTKYLEIIQEENLVENAAVQGKYLVTRLEQLQTKYPEKISNARGRGLFCAFDLNDASKRKDFIQKVFDGGAILLGSGERSIRFRPPLNISAAEIDEGIEILNKAVKEI